jgi:hypothetical protein
MELHELLLLRAKDKKVRERADGEIIRLDYST